jgi:hypothetical protein
MNKNKYIALIILCIGCLSYSCTDTQDEHYSRTASLPEQNLRELIAGDASLSVFSKLVEIAAYDTLLSSTQTFTVWAPSNTALSDIDLNTITREEARLIVGNHIARFNHSTSTPDNSRLVRMKNNKAYYFSGNGSFFGGVDIQAHDILAKNGLLHILQSRIPYHPNIYEYILATPGTSFLADFISRFDEEIFDEEASTPIDVDDSGRPVYDTVTVAYNRLFDFPFQGAFRGMPVSGLGQINREDSLYTMLVTDNTAWDAAYNRISPYFKRTDTSDSVQRIQTSLAILEDLIYRSVLENPETSDSLISTSPSIIHYPGTLFSGSEKIQASNGLIFRTANLLYDNLETWNKYLYVEADETEGRKTGANTSIFTRTLESNDTIQATDFRFLEVGASITSAQPEVTFDIPQVLSGKYNIYVEFLPGNLVTNAGSRGKSKLMFQLFYLGANGRPTDKIFTSSNQITSDTEKIKMLIATDFEFPFSNYYDRLWRMDYVNGLHTIEDFVVTTRLLMKTNVTTAELNRGEYVRSFCIDRIIFESVKN